MDTRKSTISRRSLLKGAGASALGLIGAQLLGAGRAQDSTATAAISGLYATTLGDFELHFFNDGFNAFPAEYYAANQPPGSAEAELRRFGLPTETVSFPIGVLLARSEERTILFDTGLGDLGTPGTNGNLLDSLALVGIDPASVTDVVVSHWHPDHVGAISFGDRISFPDARHHFPQAEWDFLQGPPLGDEFIDGLIAVAKAKLAPVLERDQVTFYHDEDEILPGVQALHTPGHTPGHFSFLVASAGEQLLVGSDVLFHLLQLEHPDWIFIFDAIPELTVQSRRQLFGRAADEELRIFSTHFPFPGMGRVLRSGEGFRFIPWS